MVKQTICISHHFIAEQQQATTLQSIVVLQPKVLKITHETRIGVGPPITTAAARHTVTCTVSKLVDGGTAAIISVSLTTEKAGAGSPTKRTPVAPVKPEPVMIITFPPVTGPESGIRVVMSGIEHV